MLFTIRIFSSIVIFSALTVGCTSLPKVEDEEARKHFISVGRDGGLQAAEDGQAVARLQAINESDVGIVFDKIIDGIKKHPKNDDGAVEVLIYVHGGLNSEKSALKRVQTKYNDILKDKVFPIFVNWRSGPITTYSSHLYRIRQGEVSSTGFATSPIYLGTDLAGSIVNAPKSWLITGRQALDSITTLPRQQARLEPYLNADGDNIYYTGSQEDFSTWKRTLRWWVTSPSKLITTPFIYTLARPAWDVMLRRTNTLFYKPSDHSPYDNQGVRNSEFGSGALFSLLRRLQSTAKDVPLSITLVGHSMGAIVVNKMLTLDLDLPIQNIVHMASADSINNLFDTVVPYLRDNNDVDFYSLSLHPDNENREVSAWGLTPSGSLLVWIDNMFTTPETVMDKRSGSWQNMERTYAFLPETVRPQMHFKIFGQTTQNEKDEYIISPQKHGDFGDLKFWTETAWWK